MADTTLANIADLKAYLSIQTPADDLLLQRLLNAAAGWLESRIGYGLASETVNETQDGNGSTTIIPRRYPVSSVTSVTIDGATIPQSTSIDVDGWVRAGNLIKLRGCTATRGTENVALVYVAGYATIPDDVAQAVIEIAADRFRARLRVGEVSKSVGGESVSFVTFTVPATIQTVIDAYQRVSV